MEQMKALVRSFLTDEDGSAIAEYGLLLAIVAVGLVAVLVAFKDQLARIFTSVASALQGQPGGSD